MFGTTLGAKLYNYYLVDDKWRLGTKNTLCLYEKKCLLTYVNRMWVLLEPGLTAIDIEVSLQHSSNMIEKLLVHAIRKYIFEA